MRGLDEVDRVAAVDARPTAPHASWRVLFRVQTQRRIVVVVDRTADHVLAASPFGISETEPPGDVEDGRRASFFHRQGGGRRGDGVGLVAHGISAARRTSQPGEGTLTSPAFRRIRGGAGSRSAGSRRARSRTSSWIPPASAGGDVPGEDEVAEARAARHGIVRVQGQRVPRPVSGVLWVGDFEPSVLRESFRRPTANELFPFILPESLLELVGAKLGGAGRFLRTAGEQAPRLLAPFVDQPEERMQIHGDRDPVRTLQGRRARPLWYF